MKTYDYKDEQKDVKGKVSLPPHDQVAPIFGLIRSFSALFLKRENLHFQVVNRPAGRLVN